MSCSKFLEFIHLTYLKLYPLNSIFPFLPPQALGNHYPNNVKVSEIAVSLLWCRDNLEFPSPNYLDKSLVDIFALF